MFSFALQETNSQEQFEGMSLIVFQHGIVIELLSFAIEKRF